ncbi:MAG TPA: hypothetical protein VGG14_16600 [Candidatus Sulfotelmatobacter sp.]
MHDQTPKVRWLDEALALPCDSVVTREEAADYLQPLLKRCNAKSKKTFWQWLRIQLARTEETARHLTWMQESRCPLETVRANDGFRYVINGDTALIEVGDSGDPCIWRVPVSRLSWALGLFPVYLKTLPAVESETTKQIRRLKRQFKHKMPYMTSDQRAEFVRELERLESMSTIDTSPPRYQLMKSIDGRETPVHRLYLDAGRDDHVEAVDGDFLNFTTTTVRVTVEAVAVQGIAVRKGDRPLNESFTSILPNLVIVNNDDSQQEFDRNMVQLRADLKQGVPNPDDPSPAKPTGRTPTTRQYDNKAAEDQKNAVFDDAGIPFEPWTVVEK